MSENNPVNENNNTAMGIIVKNVFLIFMPFTLF